MRMPELFRRAAGRAVALGLVAGATVALVLTVGNQRERLGESPASAPAWKGLVPAHAARVDVGQRMIVVLRAPSLADRVAAAGGVAGDRLERRWTRRALAEQRLFVRELVFQGASIRPEFEYTRVLNGFSAALDPRAVALLERAPQVAGVYPVRTAYPAGTTGRVFGREPFAPGEGRRVDVSLPGFDGTGVTVALLDTDVDRVHPYLRGRVKDTIDVLAEAEDRAGSAPSVNAVPSGLTAEDLRRHGTQMAGIVAGAHGPAGIAGVAPGASILPIRVVGADRDEEGEAVITSRTDQVLAGLERAVDPNNDGDAHDGARIAVVGAVEPLAGFAGGPLARASAGALKLDTLVVAPAGNDGPAGPGFGVVSGPGGVPAALTVGAADLRASYDRVRVAARAGLDLVLDAVVPLAGAVPPQRGLNLELGRPRVFAGRAPLAQQATALAPEDFYDEAGYSLVAGRAALLPGGDRGAELARLAAQAGAAAVVFYGQPIPAGGLGLDERVPVPVVALPPRTVRALNAAERRGAATSLAIGRASAADRTGSRGVAPFSSRGLAFDGRVKPELLAPGVAVPTSEPGLRPDGSGAYGTMNGSSASAGVVAGAAALLAQARPELDAGAIKGLLVGTARALPRESAAAQGTGLLDVPAAAAGEVVVDPPSMAWGRPDRSNWFRVRIVTVRNVSSRTLRVRLRAGVVGFPAADTVVRMRRNRLILRPGRSARVRVAARVPEPAAFGPPAEGAVVVTPVSGRPVRVPFAIPFTPIGTELLDAVRLQPASFAPSEAQPAVLSLVAGAVRSAGGDDQIEPVERLDVELWTDEGDRIGVIARARNLLPGTYTFAITGHDPGGQELAPGDYELRLVAFPVAGGPVSRRTVRFTIE